MSENMANKMEGSEGRGKVNQPPETGNRITDSFEKMQADEFQKRNTKKHLIEF